MRLIIENGSNHSNGQRCDLLAFIQIVSNTPWTPVKPIGSTSSRRVEKINRCPIATVSIYQKQRDPFNSQVDAVNRAELHRQTRQVDAMRIIVKRSVLDKRPAWFYRERTLPPARHTHPLTHLKPLFSPLSSSSSSGSQLHFQLNNTHPVLTALSVLLSLSSEPAFPHSDPFPRHASVMGALHVAC